MLVPGIDTQVDIVALRRYVSVDECLMLRTIIGNCMNINLFELLVEVNSSMKHTERTVFEGKLLYIQLGVGIRVVEQAFYYRLARSFAGEIYRMEIDEVQHVCYIHILQVGYDRIGLLGCSETRNDDVLLIVAHGKMVYQQTVLTVDDVGRMNLPRCAVDSDFRRMYADVGGRNIVLVLEELRPRIDVSLDREFCRMVVVEELGEEMIVGCGCLYVDSRTVIAPFALSDLCIYLERIVDGVQAHFGSMIVFASIVEARYVGVDVDGFLSIVHESICKDRLLYLQRNAQHALQNLGRGDFCLEGEMVLRTPVYLANARKGWQFAGYQVGETLGEGGVIVLSVNMDAGERGFEVEIAVLALVLGAYGDVIETVGLIRNLQPQDGWQQMLYMGCCGILLARNGVGAFYLDVDVRVGDGCESLYQSLLIASVYLNVAVAVLVEIEARNAALGVEMLLIAVSRK